jgi:hypothetical protein
MNVTEALLSDAQRLAYGRRRIIDTLYQEDPDKFKVLQATDIQSISLQDDLVCLDLADTQLYIEREKVLKNFWAHRTRTPSYFDYKIWSQVLTSRPWQGTPVAALDYGPSAALDALQPILGRPPRIQTDQDGVQKLYFVMEKEEMCSCGSWDQLHTHRKELEEEFGKNSLGTTKLRTILNNIGYIRRTKGTQDSVEAYISALSGCGVTTTTDVNAAGWTTSNSFGSTAINDVAYGNGLWVAVGLSGKIATSADGITWTQRTLGNTRALFSVAYGNGRWVAVGNSDAFSTPCAYSSTDGITWSQVIASESTNAYSLTEVTYKNNIWVIVGRKGNANQNPLIFVSTNGTSWTQKTYTTNNGVYPVSVDYGNGKWIAITNYQDIVVSTDNGTTWVSSSPSVFSSLSFTKIVYGNNSWVVLRSGTNIRHKSIDNGVNWVELSIYSDPVSTITTLFYYNNKWFCCDTDGFLYSSDDASVWEKIYTTNKVIGGIFANNKRMVIVGELGYLATSNLLMNFAVHPMRANLFTDPLFSNEDDLYINGSSGTHVYLTNLEQSGRRYGWGTVIKPSVTGTLPTVATTGGVLSITIPAGSGTTEIAVYSRSGFKYNPNFTYYGSAVSSHQYATRFSLIYHFESAGTIQFFDSWNDAVQISDYPAFNNVRRTVASISSTTPVVTETVIPVFYFKVPNNPSSSTVVTFSEPLFEYKNSSGEFFTGNTPMGGFIPNANIEGNPSAGLYDYHWGANGSGNPGRDFSFYTLDFQRSKSVTQDVVSNSVMPVTLVNGVDYEINWEVLE